MVCYWFEKARALVADKKAGRAGLLGRLKESGAGPTERVLQHIKESGGHLSGLVRPTLDSGRSGGPIPR